MPSSSSAGSSPVWPVDAPPLPRRDWRESVRLAGDLALVGFLILLASLPVVTAGGALSTGSEAVRSQILAGRWPDASTVLGLFRRSWARLWWAGPSLVAGVILIFLDIVGLRRGVVPGGTPMVVLVLLAALIAASWTCLRLVHARRTPALLAAAAGIVLVVAVLALLVHPVLVPALLGYALFALHATARRLP